MKKQYKALIVDDDKAIGEILAEYLHKKGLTVFTEQDPRKVLHKVDTLLPDIVFLDIRMPHIDGMTLFEKLKEEKNVYIIMMTAYATKESIIESFRKGVDDYLLKPFKLHDIDIVLTRAFKIIKLKNAYYTLKEEIKTIHEEQIITQNKKMIKILEDAKRVAPLDVSIIIYGESGTGKDLLARYIHEHSRRKDGPFIPVNLGAIPKELAESELFGHKKGAFTGAIEERQGLFKSAEGGTIFLDEIGEASLSLQVKLLRVIETRRILPIGSSKEIPVDVRIIAATNKNLEEEVKKGNFREDLYFRLNTVPFYLPPLSERKDDIPLLVEYFLKKFSIQHGTLEKKISKEALSKLLSYNWPGNVRELRHIIERAVILSKGEVIGVDDIMLHTIETKETQENIVEIKSLTEIEKETIKKALKTYKNKKKVAEVLGIDPSTLYRKMKKYGIKEDV